MNDEFHDKIAGKHRNATGDKFRERKLREEQEVRNRRNSDRNDPIDIDNIEEAPSQAEFYRLRGAKRAFRQIGRVAEFIGEDSVKLIKKSLLDQREKIVLSAIQEAANFELLVPRLKSIAASAEW